MLCSRVKQKWSAGKVACGTIVHSNDATICELASLTGFDCIWIDLEHRCKTDETAEDLIRATRAGGADCIVRLARGEFARAARIFEAGAKGIIYPRCESGAEARELVQWTKFAPLGTRGFFGANADMPYLTMDFVEYIRRANLETFLIVQLESPDAVRCAGEIAAVDGIDGLLLGPADYSVACGKPGQFAEPELAQAAVAVAQAAGRAGKQWATISNTSIAARQAVDSGAGLIFMGSDIGWLRQAYDQLRVDFLEAGLGFPQ